MAHENDRIPRAQAFDWKFTNFVILLGILVMAGTFGATQLPKWFSGEEKTTEAVQEEPPTTVARYGISVVYVKLFGPRIPSEQITTPYETDYGFAGPDSAEVLFADGTKGPITKHYGVKRGIFRFLGPEGDSVKVSWWDQKKPT